MNPSRHKTVFLTIILCYLSVVGKLIYWQGIRSFDTSTSQNKNYQPSIIYQQVGKIYDSQNHPLALSQTRYQLSIYKPDLKAPLDQLTNIVQSDDPQLQKFIINPHQKWLTLKNFYTLDQKRQLTDPGFSFTPVTERFYPEGTLAQNLIASLDTYYQKQLSGKPGFIWENVDATGKTILTKPNWYIDPVDGRQLYSSLNRTIQSIIEQQLKSGIKNYSADSGSITIMSPQTGAIIAMASFTASSSATSATNTPISHLFEPGSIFKPLVVAMALDSQSISSNYICTQCGSPHQIGQYTIGNWDNALHPNSSLDDIIKNSDNIGMSHIIDRLGLTKFLQYFTLLNLDRKTGIDLSGEARPVIKEYWPEIDLATASFGQGFAITQIQMLTAFNVLANNGLLVTPKIAQYFRSNNSTISLSQPQPIRIFQDNSVSQVKKILKYAVENGTVAKFKPDNIEVCAKSGTSQVAVRGGYSESSTIASYIGFSPCDNPRFTMIVTINNPRTSPWGSSTAAPIWYGIAKQLQPLL